MVWVVIVVGVVSFEGVWHACVGLEVACVELTLTGLARNDALKRCLHPMNCTTVFQGIDDASDFIRP